MTDRPPLEYSDSYIHDVLTRNKVIAVVGASPRWERPSCYTMQYLQSMGYTVIPVNPTEAGGEILGRPVYATLDDIPEPIDLVSIFRKPEKVGPIVDDAIRLGAKAIWMQEGVRDDRAAARARDAGLNVIMDLCPKKEHFRLLGGGGR